MIAFEDVAALICISVKHHVMMGSESQCAVTTKACLSESGSLLNFKLSDSVSLPISF